MRGEKDHLRPLWDVQHTFRFLFSASDGSSSSAGTLSISSAKSSPDSSTSWRVREIQWPHSMREEKAPFWGHASLQEPSFQRPSFHQRELFWVVHLSSLASPPRPRHRSSARPHLWTSENIGMSAPWCRLGTGEVFAFGRGFAAEAFLGFSFSALSSAASPSSSGFYK